MKTNAKTAGKMLIKSVISLEYLERRGIILNQWGSHYDLYLRQFDECLAELILSLFTCNSVTWQLSRYLCFI